MNKQFLLTAEGINDLQSELAELIEARTPLAERIKTAREMGDLSENAEYQTAREDHTKLEARISEIEHILRNHQEIVKSDTGEVVLGSTVRLKGEADGSAREFQVVGTLQADPMNGKVSNESPIGVALLGKKAGDKVDIKTPAESLTFTVSEIL